MEPKPSPDVIRQRVVSIVGELRRPALIGYVATELGWWATLPNTEAILDDLVAANELRRLNAAEEKHWRMKHAYVLAGVEDATKMG